MPLPDKSANGEDSGLANAVKNRSAHVVHLTHNDLDAVGADAIHRMKYGNGEVFTIWSSVGKFATLFSLVASCKGKGDLLSISDLGYQKDTETIAGKARANGWNVEWRDHHRWRDDEVKKVTREVSLLRIDTAVCACGIVARDLTPENPLPLRLHGLSAIMISGSMPIPVLQYSGRCSSARKTVSMSGTASLPGYSVTHSSRQEYAEIKAEMDAMMQRSLRHATILGTRYRIAFAPLYGYPSETAHFIRNERKTDIEVIISKDGKFSLRSVPPISHLIAREFGGGGHPNAAGGSFNFTVIERFAWWLFKKSRHFKEFVTIADAH